MSKSVNIVAAKKVAIMLLFVVLVGVSGEASAKRYIDRQSLVWTHHTDHRGRYTGRYLFVAQGLNLTLSTNYYYGDIDYTGIAFKQGFQPNTFNFLGGVTFTYQYPLGDYFNFRSSLGLGALRGAVDSVYRGYPMTFRNIYLEPAAVVDFYPFGPYPYAWLGFYVYVGFGANVGFIHYDFGNPPGEHVVGDVVRCLPIIPFGIGWAIPFGRSSGWMAHVEVGLHQGVIDTPTMNLDAYPMTKEQNGVRDYGRSRQESGKRTNEWADGYFQLGLTISYRWL